MGGRIQVLRPVKRIEHDGFLRAQLLADGCVGAGGLLADDDGIWPPIADGDDPPSPFVRIAVARRKSAGRGLAPAEWPGGACAGCGISGTAFPAGVGGPGRGVGGARLLGGNLSDRISAEVVSDLAYREV